MIWYDWKLWRFAYSKGSYAVYGQDDDGGWVRILGGLWWLKYPKNKKES